MGRGRRSRRATSLWRRLEALRRLHPDPYSISAIARAIGESERAVYATLSRRGGVSSEAAKKLATILGVNPEAIPLAVPRGRPRRVSRRVA